MDLQAYITSGVLEQYVLGLLSPEESREVERMAEEHPVIREELNKLEDSLAQFAQSQAVPMSADLPDKIMDRIQETTPSAPAKNRSLRTGLIVLLAAASVALALLAYQQVNRVNTLEEELRTNQLAYQALADSCSSCEVRVNTLEEQIAILKSDDYQLIRLNGTDKDPAAIASIYYNTTNQKSYLELTDLPALPEGKQYQLWAIVEAGPTGMGVFDLPDDPNTLFEVPHFGEAQAFAITIEDAGGVEEPTLTEMIVLGTVG